MLHGSNVLVSGGASATFPALVSYANALPVGLTSQTRTLSAMGAGSLLDLHNVETIANGLNYQTRLVISAAGGGAIDLSGTESIVDSNIGDLRYRTIDITADGAGSNIDLSALTTFSDSYAGSTTGENRYSSLTAKNAGVIDAGMLATLTGVNVTLDGSGTLPAGQITTLANSQLTLSGAGANYVFTSLANLDGSDVLVTGGASAAFPRLASYTNTPPPGVNSQTRTLSAAGTGSLLDLHNVATISNGSNYQTRLAISATGGGAIDLSGATSIVDPNAGDQRYRTIDVTADGAGSDIDLSALVAFTDNYAGSTTSDNRYSTLTAKNSGTIEAGALATLTGVNVTLDGTGTLPVGQIATLANSQLTLSGAGANYVFTALVNLDGSNVLVTGGASAALPALTSYTNTPPPGINNQTRTLSAAGTGSLLDLHNVATIANGLSLLMRLAISATGGGVIDLSGTTSITDPNAGDQRYRAIDVTADGAGSTVDLSSLTTFTDNYAGNTGGEDRSSTLVASNSGTVALATGVNSHLVGVLATVSSSGTISGNLQLSSSVLQGDGTVTGNVINGGTINPGGGAVAGTLSISGNFTQFAGGAINVELGGLSAGSQYDRLAVGGAAALAGTLNVSFIGGFTPAVGNGFQVLTFAGSSGDFLTYNGLTLGAASLLRTSLGASDLTLTAAATDIRVTPTVGLVTSAEGDSATFSVVLTTAPTDTVTIPITSSNPSAWNAGCEQPHVHAGRLRPAARGDGDRRCHDRQLQYPARPRYQQRRQLRHAEAQRRDGGQPGQRRGRTAGRESFDHALGRIAVRANDQRLVGRQ